VDPCCPVNDLTDNTRDAATNDLPGVDPAVDLLDLVSIEVLQVDHVRVKVAAGRERSERGKGCYLMWVGGMCEERSDEQKVKREVVYCSYLRFALAFTLLLLSLRSSHPSLLVHSHLSLLASIIVSRPITELLWPSAGFSTLPLGRCSDCDRASEPEDNSGSCNEVAAPGTGEKDRAVGSGLGPDLFEEALRAIRLFC